MALYYGEVRTWQQILLFKICVDYYIGKCGNYWHE